MNHIAIFDIGKTNKKCFVFDEHYRIVFEKSVQLPETTDEDGDPCEDLNLLKNWVLESRQEILTNRHFRIRAMNCSTYGASLVHLDRQGHPLTPLYNYLKPFPPALKGQFFRRYDEAATLALHTASPILDHLNAGLQLYWLKNQKPQIFQRIKYSLHLPQYIASLLGGHFFSEITSLGCHTMLWNFQKNDYHDWVIAEQIAEKFPPLTASHLARPAVGTPSVLAGAGLHDSSAALIPYLEGFPEPFVLISTGTWCIALNPFDAEPLTEAELKNDCLCYLTYAGKPVKAARYFGGHYHERFTRVLAKHFEKPPDFYQTVRFDPQMLPVLTKPPEPKEPGAFKDYETAYHYYMNALMTKQQSAIGHLHLSGIRYLLVDGGFSTNDVYMNLLARAFPEMDVYAADIAQASALGAAMAIHACWNEGPLPRNLVRLKPMQLLPI